MPSGATGPPRTRLLGALSRREVNRLRREAIAHRHVRTLPGLTTSCLRPRSGRLRTSRESGVGVPRYGRRMSGMVERPCFQAGPSRVSPVSAPPTSPCTGGADGARSEDPCCAPSSACGEVDGAQLCATLARRCVAHITPRVWPAAGVPAGQPIRAKTSVAWLPDMGDACPGWWRDRGVRPDLSLCVSGPAPRRLPLALAEPTGRATSRRRKSAAASREGRNPVPGRRGTRHDLFARTAVIAGRA